MSETKAIDFAFSLKSRAIKSKPKSKNLCVSNADNIYADYFVKFCVHSFDRNF